MSKAKKVTGALVATAVAGMFMAGHAIAADTTATVAAKVKCEGVNECKGKGQCAGAAHSCAGKNECKGKGWITIEEKECTEKGGTVKQG